MKKGFHACKLGNQLGEENMKNKKLGRQEYEKWNLVITQEKT